MTPSLRVKVRRRARGRCEYCRTPFRYNAIKPEVDHIIAEKHDGPTSLRNLAMACAHCNSYKGPNVAGVDPVTSEVVRLFNPRVDKWANHFRWSGPRLIGQTKIGRATIGVLFINDPLEVAARTMLMEEGRFRPEP